MKTKIIAALLTMTLLFSFAACGKADTGATTTAESTTIQTTLQETSVTAAGTTTEAVTTQTQTDVSTAASTTAATTKATIQAATTTVPAGKSFTKTELAKFDGKSGRNGYIAYEGIVYDVTDIKLWDSGVHQGLKVGTDLTTQVNSCDHHAIVFMKAQFSTYPKVGTYIG